MKKLLCIYYLLCIATLAYAQDLRFNANGKFKIVQFTDNTSVNFYRKIKS